MIARDRPTRARSRGFSLIELLIAIFILGIGAISIAALFPAGIAQQRRTVDDSIGPIVAASALSTLRAKLDPTDFGTFEDFGVLPPRRTIPGDWPWLRPSFIFNDLAPNDEVDTTGAIDIFSFDWATDAATDKATEFYAFGSGYEDLNGSSVPFLWGIPYSKFKHGNAPPPPRILFTRRERYYPQAPESAGLADSRPQYVWDCMFRRFEGRIQVAIFVYRATPSGGASANVPYVVPRHASGVALPLHESLPPIPMRRSLDGLGDGSSSAYWQGPDPGPVPEDAWDADGCDGDPFTNADNAIVFGSDCDDYDPFDPSQSWQEPGQWMLDQNNNTHRVLASYCNDEDMPNCPANVQGRRRVELVRPIPEIPIQTRNPPCDPALSDRPRREIPSLYTLWLDECDEGFENVVSDIWYVPTHFRGADDREWELTPIYLGVMEL